MKFKACFCGSHFFHRCLLFGWMVVWLSSLGQLCPTWNSSQAEKRLTSSTPSTWQGMENGRPGDSQSVAFGLYLTFPNWSRFHHLRILIIPKRAQTRRITRFLYICLLLPTNLGIIQLSNPPRDPLGFRRFSERSRFSARSKKPWRVAMRKPFERPRKFECLHEFFWGMFGSA